MNSYPQQTSDLGHVIGEFGWNKSRAKTLLWMWGFMFIFSLPLSFVLIGLPGLILSGIFLRRSLQRLRTKTPVISVCQQGLIDARQATPRILRYEDIKNLFLSVVITNGIMNYIVTLETQSGEKIKIDEHVANVDQLRTALEENFVQVKLPAAIAAYQQGHAIAFDQLEMNSAGLSFRKKSLAWSEFQSAAVERRSNFVYLMIYQKNPQKEWLSYSRDNFPNLALFFVLINYITQPTEGPGEP